MPESVLSLIDKLEEAATLVQDPRASETVRALRAYSGTSKLQILLVGPTGAGRSSLVNAMLERPGLLPQSAIPKAPLAMTVCHGSSEMVRVVARDGTRAAMRPARLRSFLTTPDAARTYLRVEVEAPCELLKTCDLTIEALEARYSAERWRAVLSSSDFALLVLNATALLSHEERQFVREYLAASYGLQRVAILVNQTDRVPEEERSSLLELLRTFLGPYESQPAILQLSASRALAQVGAGPGENDVHDELRTLMSDLVNRHAQLREASLQQALHAAVAELEAGVARQQALLSMDQSEIEELRRTMAARREWLQERVGRTQRRVDTFVGTLIREQLRREIEGFGQLLRRRLPDEIMRVEDIAAIKRHLPGYIEAMWSEFLSRQMIGVRSKLFDESRTISQMIESDLRGLLGDESAGLSHVLSSFDPAAEALRTFIMPKRGKHHASGVAKGLSLHGYVMLFVDPPLGVLSLAASQIVRRVYQRGIATSEKEAIVAAAVAATRDVERELQGRVEAQFSRLTTALKTEVASIYAAGVAGIEEFLEQGAARGRETRAKADQMVTFRAQTIPQLRQLLQQVDWRNVA